MCHLISTVNESSGYLLQDNEEHVKTGGFHKHVTFHLLSYWLCSQENALWNTIMMSQAFFKYTDVAFDRAL